MQESQASGSLPCPSSTTGGGLAQSIPASRQFETGTKYGEHRKTTWKNASKPKNNVSKSCTCLAHVAHVLLTLLYELCQSQVAEVVITWQTSPVDRLILQILLPTKITMRSSVTAFFAKPLQMKQPKALRLLRLINLWHDMYCVKLVSQNCCICYCQLLPGARPA